MYLCRFAYIIREKIKGSNPEAASLFILFAVSRWTGLTEETET